MTRAPCHSVCSCSISCSDPVLTQRCVSAGIGHLSLKRKGALSVAENGGSLRRSCEFGSDMLWPPPLESEGRSRPGAERPNPAYGIIHTKTDPNFTKIKPKFIYFLPFIQ